MFASAALGYTVRMIRIGFLGPLALAAALLPAPARGDVWVAGGLSFSDELGGVRILSVTGTGSTSDPIVLVEEISHVGPVIVVIRRIEVPEVRDHRIPTPQVLSIAVTKVVINRSRRVWGGFDLELREEVGRPSPYGDGLSFDQSRLSRWALDSDSFAVARQIDEPRDLIRFVQGSVDPGGVGKFDFSITDPTPVGEFYLLQEPQLLIADTPARRAVAAAR